MYILEGPSAEWKGKVGHPARCIVFVQFQPQGNITVITDTKSDNCA